MNDQNLCIPASSSFVYGAVPIGASIYVIGDLDTGILCGFFPLLYVFVSQRTYCKAEGANVLLKSLATYIFGVLIV